MTLGDLMASRFCFRSSSVVVAVLNHHLDEYTESSEDVEYWVSSGLQRIRDHETCDAASISPAAAAV